MMLQRINALIAMLIELSLLMIPSCTLDRIAGAETTNGTPIRGALYTVDGAPAAGVPVVLHKADYLDTENTGGLNAATYTNKNGLFNVNEPLAGDYILSAIRNDNHGVAIRVTVNGSGDTITLPADTLRPTSIVQGTIIFPDSVSSYGAFAVISGLDGRTQIGPDWKYTFKNIPQGTFSLKIVGDTVKKTDSASLTILQDSISVIGPLILGRNPPGILDVGESYIYSDIETAYSVALNGDTILVHSLAQNAAYTHVALLMKGKRNIHIIGAGISGLRVKVDGTGFDYSGVGSVPRAAFQFDRESDGSTIENFEIYGCANGSCNGSGVRINQANQISVSNCDVHTNDIGICSNGFFNVKSGADQLIENCSIHQNGCGNQDLSDNLSLCGTSAVVRGCDIYGGIGQSIRSSVHKTVFLGCFIHYSGNRELDLQDEAVNSSEGGIVLISGCVIVKDPACAGNKTVIHFGMGDSINSSKLYIVHTTIISPFIAPVVDLSAPNASVWLFNSMVLDQNGVTPNQVLIESREGASLATSGAKAVWLTNGFAVPSSGDFSVTTGTAGDRPAFVDENNGDYHLSTTFAGIVDKGIPWDSLTIMAELKSYPILLFMLPSGFSPRTFNGIPDIGAYEFAVQ